MAILRFAVVALAACYGPDARDCTVTCETNAGCTNGQICGADGYCAAPEVAGRCVEPDAAPPPPPPIDAPARGELQVTITGKGVIVVAGHGTCDWEAPQDGDCAYSVPLGVELALTARADSGYELDRWTSECTGDAATCTLVPKTPRVFAGAAFRKLHDN